MLDMNSNSSPLVATAGSLEIQKRENITVFSMVAKAVDNVKVVDFDIKV